MALLLALGLASTAIAADRPNFVLIMRDDMGCSDIFPICLASHDRALYIKEGWIRDPYITLAPDDFYYLTGTTINQRGTTIVPLDVKLLDDGTVHIRAKDPAYATPGPDEVQKFD